jgi:hypothetical protein
MAARLNLVTTLFVAIGIAAAATAQVSPGLPADNPKPPETPKRVRAISPEVAKQLSAMTPKYNPAAPKPVPKPEEELPDLRETDKPKNGIIRLPKYVVQEARPVVLSERAVNTKQGLADLAVRRYMSEADRALNRFTLPLFGTSMQDRALLMYGEDERLQNMAELNDNAATAAKSDPAAGAYIRREAEKTFMRTSDFGSGTGSNGGVPK